MSKVCQTFIDIFNAYIGRGTHADYWPATSSNDANAFHTTPLLPNWVALPGRLQDNQRRHVSECHATNPLYEEAGLSRFLRKLENEGASQSR